MLQASVQRFTAHSEACAERRCGKSQRWSMLCPHSCLGHCMNPLYSSAQPEWSVSMLLFLTGKTTAIVEIILQEVKRGNKVLSLSLILTAPPPRIKFMHLA